MKSMLRLEIKKIQENPWHFRLMYQSDFDSIVESIKNAGVESVPYPIVAQIKKKFYIVDGHSRIKAALKSGETRITCQLFTNIKDLHDLRIASFQMNKEGYSNPLLLSDMFYEEIQSGSNTDKVAQEYNVNKKYVSTLLKIRSLHDDTKSVINKILENSKKKYQFILNQITPDHLASIADLPPEKQTLVVDWIFRDIMYGPTDETLVSIPSVHEVLEEIEKISETKQKKTYKKRSLQNKVKEFPLTCRCGLRFDINIKNNTVYEHIEQNNVIIKKKFERGTDVDVFSSKFYPKEELVSLIKNAKFDVTIVLTKGILNEIRE
ncbi:ParB/RepB/Spo0J family partition protein [Nitrosopumilus ureiphilus]|uniref:Chromosome partitioning protein ParB n=1 Tax=Nitrosopumilus ureiphilus TaxID=1470067 RepID=A0A7D5R294_9ARCH|nr:ParB/RepB/Spo0J family partition protein [Nitrosopumilus ureiphilus]QLH07296.1 chromosome partitioning protein ParB [Nitrosopumilus ureiphilus]